MDFLLSIEKSLFMDSETSSHLLLFVPSFVEREVFFIDAGSITIPLNLSGD